MVPVQTLSNALRSINNYLLTIDYCHVGVGGLIPHSAWQNLEFKAFGVVIVTSFKVQVIYKQWQNLNM